MTSYRGQLETLLILILICPPILRQQPQFLNSHLANTSGISYSDSFAWKSDEMVFSLIFLIASGSTWKEFFQLQKEIMFWPISPFFPLIVSICGSPDRHCIGFHNSNSSRSRNSLQRLKQSCECLWVFFFISQMLWILPLRVMPVVVWGCSRALNFKLVCLIILCHTSSFLLLCKKIKMIKMMLNHEPLQVVTPNRMYSRCSNTGHTRLSEYWNWR